MPTAYAARDLVQLAAILGTVTCCLSYDRYALLEPYLPYTETTHKASMLLLATLPSTLLVLTRPPGRATHRITPSTQEPEAKAMSAAINRTSPGVYEWLVVSGREACQPIAGHKANETQMRLLFALLVGEFARLAMADLVGIERSTNSWTMVFTFIFAYWVSRTTGEGNIAPRGTDTVLGESGVDDRT